MSCLLLCTDVLFDLFVLICCMSCLLLCTDVFPPSSGLWLMVYIVISRHEPFSSLVDHSLIAVCSSLCFVGRPDEFLSNDLLSLHVRSLTTDKWQIHTTYVTVCRTCNHYPVYLQSFEKFHFQNSKCMYFSAIPNITHSVEEKNLKEHSE